MSGNTEIIDTVVSPDVPKQIETLKAGLGELDTLFIETAKSADVLNKAILNTKTYKDYTKAVGDASVANEKLKVAQQNTVKATAQAEKAQLSLSTAQDRATKQQERAAEAARKALSPYQQLSKELDKQRAAAKDLGVQYGLQSPQFRQAAKGVQEMDGQLKAIDQTLGQSQRNVGNYANSFREVLTAYIPFGDATLKVSENLKKLTEGMGEGKTELGALGAGFLEFSTTAFIVAIASASYYLSQFASTKHTIDKFISGLKSQFADLGESVVDNVKAFSFSHILGIASQGKFGDVGELKGKEYGKGFADSFQKGVDEEADKIDVENIAQISDHTIAANNAEIANLRALSSNRDIDISKRREYLKKAQDLAKENQKIEEDDAENQINLAIRTGDRFNKLTYDQAQQLSKGDLQLAQDLAENGQQFTEKGYELYRKGLDAKIKARESSATLALQLQADENNQELRADKALAQAQERLDKAKLQRALDTAKQTLDDDTKGYDDKVRANKTFVDKSIALIELQKKHELDAAGVPARGGRDSRTEAKNRAAIEVETQDAIKKVQNEGAANLRKIIKDNNALYAKDAEERLKLQIGLEKQLEDVFVNAQNKKLQDIEFFRSQQVNALVQQYSAGKVSEQAFNQQLYEIDAQASEDRIQLQIDTLKKIAEAQASALALGFGDPKEIQATGEKINNLVIQQDNLKTQRLIKNAQELNLQRKEVHDKEKELADDATTFINTLVDASFQKQLDHIKDLETAVDNQAKSEKDAVNGSIQSQAEKARKNNLIDARAAQDKAKLEEQARKTQQKQAEYDRLFSAAKIVQNTAIGVTSALAEFPPNIPLAVLVGAIGAVQLGTMLATPLPKFAEGGTTAGGYILWGEKGVERAEEPSGRVSYSPATATVGNFPAGTKITSNYDLTSGMIRPDKLVYHTQNQDSAKLDQLISETRKNRPSPQRAPRASGWMRETAKADSWAQYSNRYFR